jgi:hypothetical protein
MISSIIWIILVIGGSAHIYPKKIKYSELGEKALVHLFAKENKTYEENIAILTILRKKKTFELDEEEIKDLAKESIASLSFSIIQHQRKYNKKKQKAIELLFLGSAILLGVWGLLYFVSEKKD